VVPMPSAACSAMEMMTMALLLRGSLVLVALACSEPEAPSPRRRSRRERDDGARRWREAGHPRRGRWPAAGAQVAWGT
jgi:hypothetical protein